MLSSISQILSEQLRGLSFADPVTHTYDPTDYAWAIHSSYVDTYAEKQPVLLLGMNPGPWGMAQSGVPFGDVGYVRDFLGLSGAVTKPVPEHAKRPIDGLECSRSEVSGSRLWGWAKEQFGTSDAFFETFFVWNYCPLSFMEEGGRNRTPDKLPKAERDPLFSLCDETLRALCDAIEPQWVIGVGAFAEKRATVALRDYDVEIARILHPSPASPKANRGWAEAATEELRALGIEGLHL